MTKWTAADVPDQSGRVAVITGSNTGIGYEAAAVLAERGAHVVLAVRNLDKGKDAAARTAAQSPNADVTLRELDLTSLDSIRNASNDLRAAYPRIDLLINNAGVMTTPKRHHQGRLRTAVRHQPPRPFRAHRSAAREHASRRRLSGGDDQQPGPPRRPGSDFDDLQWERSYNRVFAYAQSKLANLLFTYELARRLAAKGVPTIAVAAHPGSPNTELTRDLPGLIRPAVEFVSSLVTRSPRWARSRRCGPRPTPTCEMRQYYGPDGIGEQRGHPKLVESSAQSHDEEIQRRLWTRLRGVDRVTYPV